MEEDYFDDTESEQDKIESADSSEMQKDFVNKGNYLLRTNSYNI